MPAIFIIGSIAFSVSLFTLAVLFACPQIVDLIIYRLQDAREYLKEERSNETPVHKLAKLICLAHLDWKFWTIYLALGITMGFLIGRL